MLEVGANRIARRQLFIAAGAAAMGVALSGSSVRAQTQLRTISPVATLDPAPNGEGSALSVARNGKALLTSRTIGSVADVYDFASNAWVASLSMENNVEAFYAGFVGDGTQAITAAGNTVLIWEVATERTIRTITLDGPKIKALAVAPDGRFMAVGQNRTITLYDFDSDARINTRRDADKGAITRLAFSSDGKRLACAYVGSLRVYDLASLSSRTPLADWDVGLSSSFAAGGMALSPEGRLLLFGEAERITIFDVTSKEPVGRIDRVGQERSIFDDLAVFRNGRLFAAADRNGDFLIGDVTKRAFIARSADPALKPLSIAISPDDKKAYVARTSDPIVVFDISEAD
jgi:WD40 repeat protein